MDDSPFHYFYDTEFIDNGTTIDLVSIGVVAVPDWCLDPTMPHDATTDLARRHARTYYAVNADADIDALKRNEWLVRNVLPHLPVESRKSLDAYIANPSNHHPWPSIEYVELSLKATEVKPKWVIANEVRDFLLAPFADADDGAEVTIELWADYGAYDHVALAQLWGPMIALPAGVPMYTNDLQQLRRTVGDLEYRPDVDPDAEHNALADAWYALDLYRGLRIIEHGRHTK
jgi:hypothetical protein